MYGWHEFGHAAMERKSKDHRKHAHHQTTENEADLYMVGGMKGTMGAEQAQKDLEWWLGRRQMQSQLKQLPHTSFVNQEKSQLAIDFLASNASNFDIKDINSVHKLAGNVKSFVAERMGDIEVRSSVTDDAQSMIDELRGNNKHLDSAQELEAVTANFNRLAVKYENNHEKMEELKNAYRKMRYFICTNTKIFNAPGEPERMDANCEELDQSR